MPGWRPLPNWGRVFSWFLLLEMFFFHFFRRDEKHISSYVAVSNSGFQFQFFESWCRRFSKLTIVLPFLQKRVVVFVWWLHVCMFASKFSSYILRSWAGFLPCCLGQGRPRWRILQEEVTTGRRHRWDLEPSDGWKLWRIITIGVGSKKKIMNLVKL